jgi:DNA-binding NtrC family response regulator
VVRIRVPSLARRKEDILPLARLFLHQYAEKFGKKFTDLTEHARAALLGHVWTGNVRELRNIMERAALMACGPELDAEDLGSCGQMRPGPGKPERPDGGRSGSAEPAAGYGTRYYMQALSLAEGNESQAAGCWASRGTPSDTGAASLGV